MWNLQPQPTIQPKDRHVMHEGGSHGSYTFCKKVVVDYMGKDLKIHLAQFSDFLQVDSSEARILP